jgi:hypothetical protein
MPRESPRPGGIRKRPSALPMIAQPNRQVAFTPRAIVAHRIPRPEPRVIQYRLVRANKGIAHALSERTPPPLQTRPTIRAGSPARWLSGHALYSCRHLASALSNCKGLGDRHSPIPVWHLVSGDSSLRPGARDRATHRFGCASARVWASSISCWNLASPRRFFHRKSIRSRCPKSYPLS